MLFPLASMQIFRMADFRADIFFLKLTQFVGRDGTIHLEDGDIQYQSQKYIAVRCIEYFRWKFIMTREVRSFV